MKWILTATSKYLDQAHDLILPFIKWHEGIISYHLDKERDVALSLLELAIELLENKQHLDGNKMRIEITNSIGIIYLEENNYNDAEEKFKNCITLLSSQPLLELNDLKIKLLFNLSILHLKQDKFSQALQCCDRGINQCKETNSMYLLGDLYYHKALCLHNMGFEEVTDYFTFAMTILKIQENDYLHNRVKNKALSLQQLS
ncbi:MAG: hypothetical protein WD907_03710 [Bacilli bacterium]